MEDKGHPTEAGESSCHDRSAAAEDRPSAKEAADGGPPSKEAGDGTAEGRPPLSKQAVAGEEITAVGDQERDTEVLGEPGADGEGAKKPTADELEKPTADEAGRSGDEPKDPTAEEAGRSSEEPKKPTARSTTVRAWVAGLGTIGDELQGYSMSVSGFQGSLAHISEFMQRVATYAPNGETAGPGPAVLTSIAGYCGNVGAFLGHVASTVQGATSLGLLLGAAFQQVAWLYGPEEVPEPEGKPEATSPSTKTKIIVSTVEQAEKVINWISDDETGFEVDVDLNVTPWMAVKIYEQFRFHGAPVLSLISRGATMKAKRAAFYENKD